MHNLKLVAAYLKHNFMTAMAYRGAFFLQVAGMMLNDLMLLFFWVVLFSRMPMLNGWDLQGILLIYSIAAFGFGLGTGISDNAMRVAPIIANGDLDYYLALPADPLLHLLISRISLPGWGDALFGLFLFLASDSQHWTQLPLFLLLGTLSAVIFISFNIIMGSLAFWLGQAESLASQLNNALLAFSLYPAEIFPGLIRVLLYTFLPAALIGTFPATLLLEFSWIKLGELILFAVGVGLAARTVFRKGLQRYESGNQITARA